MAGLGPVDDISRCGASFGSRSSLERDASGSLTSGL